MPKENPIETEVERIFDLTIDNLSVNTIKLYNIIEKIGEGITLINKKGDFDLYNKKMEQLTGYTKEECNSIKNIFNILLPNKQDLKKAIKKVVKLKNEGDSTEFEIVIKNKNGILLNLWVTFTLLNFNGNPWYLSVYRNDTDRKKEETALLNSMKREKEANQLKSAFIANVSHEFRTPLNGILGSIQILKKEGEFTPAQKESLDIIENSGRYLFDLIEDVLYLSKIESNQLHIFNSPFPLKNCLIDIVEIYKIKIKKKNLNFFYEFSDNLPEYVQGDDKKITYIIFQLLENALKFTKEGSICFKVWKEMETIFFSVEDTGIGMEQNCIQKIFDPFIQLSPRLNKTEGSGIGLTIVCKLIELLGGDLLVKSEIEKGSTFKFAILLPECSGNDFCSKIIEKNIFTQKKENDENDLLTEPIEKQISLIPKEIAKELYSATLIGDVDEIENILNKIKDKDAKFTPMTKWFMGLIHSFKMKEIHDMVTNNLRF